MRTGLALLVLGTALLTVSACEASELFNLVVDPVGSTPFFDATGRHVIETGAVANINTGGPIVPGSAVATNVESPDGAYAALLTGGWLEITTSNPSFASDFLFAANQNLTVTFWFKSTGNGAYHPTPSLHRYPDRVHALGFGDASNNLDVDFGDEDPVPASGDETACWTYFGSEGVNNVASPINNRNHYLDDEWHHYGLVRNAVFVTVYIDGSTLGTTTYLEPLGSDSESTHNYIGRASVFTGALFVGDPFPWFGYIASVRVFDEGWLGADGAASVVGPGRLSGFPNPFRTSVNMWFAMPETGPWEATIFGISGRVVRRFRGDSVRAGAEQATWDGKDDAGHMVAPGLYLARVQGRGLNVSTKVLRIP